MSRASKVPASELQKGKVYPLTEATLVDATGRVWAMAKKVPPPVLGKNMCVSVWEGNLYSKENQKSCSFRFPVKPEKGVTMPKSEEGTKSFADEEFTIKIVMEATSDSKGKVTHRAVDEQFDCSPQTLCSFQKKLAQMIIEITEEQEAKLGAK